MPTANRNILLGQPTGKEFKIWEGIFWKQLKQFLITTAQLSCNPQGETNRRVKKEKELFDHFNMAVDVINV